MVTQFPTHSIEYFNYVDRVFKIIIKTSSHFVQVIEIRPKTIEALGSVVYFCGRLGYGIDFQQIFLNE